MGVYGDVVVSDGLCVSCTVSKKGGCQIHSAVTYMMAGLLVLNVYAEYFSLFAGVGFWASLIAVLLRSSAECCCVGIWRIFQNFENTGMSEKTERSDEGIENSKSLWRKKTKPSGCCMPV